MEKKQIPDRLSYLSQEEIEENEMMKRRINFVYTFIWAFIILGVLAFVILICSYYTILTEEVSTVKEYDFGYCDIKIVSLPEHSDIICTKEGMVRDFFGEKVIYPCLTLGNATCLVKTTERRWK